MEHTPQTDRPMLNVALLMLLATAGCSPVPDMRDQRLVEFAHRSMEQQAKQNQYIAQQSQAVVEESQELAEASKELVASDAKARQDLIGAQERLTAQLHEQRAAVAAGRDQLEAERKQIAEQRHRDPLVAAAIQNVGLIIACLLPLIVCIFVIRQMSRPEPDDAAVAELLVHELVTDQPRLLPGPSIRRALEHHADQDVSNDSAPDRQLDTADLPF